MVDNCSFAAEDVTYLVSGVVGYSAFVQALMPPMTLVSLGTSIGTKEISRLTDVEGVTLLAQGRIWQVSSRSMGLLQLIMTEKCLLKPGISGWLVSMLPEWVSRQR
ncbi:MAG: hypothetical protein PVS3B3_22410 [Ktedonobacteraceae bacterium]